MRVTCIGHVMIDVLAQLPGALAIGSDTPAPISLLGGGSAANTAAWLAHAGVEATFVGRVGDDAFGRAATDELARAGVHLDVEVDDALPTGTCVVLVDPSGERTMVPSAGANARGNLPGEIGDWLHVSGYALFTDESARFALAAIERARAGGVGLSIDAASAAPLRDYGPSRFVDAVAPAVLFANADEATTIAGTRDMEAAARSLGARCGEAIVKCGADGAAWSDGTQVVRAAGPAVDVHDSTGAGDAFAAGVLEARLSGAGVLEALQAGNALAARALVRTGARPPVV